MCSEHGVLAWFKELDPADRIKFMCNLFSCCLPEELRYFVTYVTGTKLAAPKANINCCSTWTTLDDPITRSGLVISVVFLEKDNRLLAEHIFQFILQSCTSDWMSVITDKTAVKQMNLLLTLAVNHPAFGFKQKLYFARLTELLKTGALQGKTRKNMGEVSLLSIRHNDMLLSDPFSPGPVEHKSISVENSFPSSLLKGCKDIPQEHLSSQPLNQPCLSSQSKEPSSDLPKNEVCSSDIPEISCMSREVLAVSSLLKKDMKDVLQHESSVSSSLEGSTSAMPVGEQSFSPSYDSAAVVPVKEQSYSSQPGYSVDVVPMKKPSLSSPLEENSSSLQENLSSSNLEARKSAELKKLDLPATTSAILNRCVTRRFGRIRNLELKGNGKKGAYRIEVTWACGKKTESLKTPKELKTFQQMVTKLISDASLQKTTKKDISAFPDLSTFLSFGEDFVEQYDKLAIYLSDFLTVLPLSIRDNNSVVTFFGSLSSQLPRPILVGQGNLNQSSLVEKLSPVPHVPAPHRNRNNGKYVSFPERQFRNSSSSWKSPSNAHSWNPHRSSYPSGQPKSSRQRKFKFYPPISVSCSSSSSQNSQSGSSQNSRSSSPCAESGQSRVSLQNSMKSNQSSHLESEFHKESTRTLSRSSEGL